MGMFERIIKGRDWLPPRADTWNLLMEMAERYRRGLLDTSSGTIVRSLERGVVWIENTSGVARDRGEVLALDEPLYKPDDHLNEFLKRFSFKGVSPSVPKHRGKFAVTIDAIPDGKIGRAVVSGVVPARLEVKNEYHQLADVAAGTCESLRTGGLGAAKILWCEPKVEGGSAGDKRWAIVDIGQLTAFKLFGWTEGIAAAVKDGTYISPGVGGVTIWDFADPDDVDAGDDDFVQTDQIETAYHYGPDPIDAGFVQLTFNGRRLVPDVKYCGDFPA